MRSLWAIGALVVVSVGVGASGFRAPIPTLRLGSEGGEVATWQATLKYIMAQSHSRERLVVDGDFGPPANGHLVWWQIALDRWIERRHAPIPLLVPDGMVGPLTNRVAIAFQRASHLNPNGYVGPRSWARMVRDGRPTYRERVPSEPAAALVSRVTIRVSGL